jgi:hypothetical protein
MPVSASRVIAFVLVVSASLAVARALLIPAAEAATGGGRTYEVKVGDVVKLTNGRLGCAVRRRDGQTVFDCRRAGSLRGSYGTMTGESRVLVVRFLSEGVAHVVFAAKQGGEAARCR